MGTENPTEAPLEDEAAQSDWFVARLDAAAAHLNRSAERELMIDGLLFVRLDYCVAEPSATPGSHTMIGVYDEGEAHLHLYSRPGVGAYWLTSPHSGWDYNGTIPMDLDAPRALTADDA